LVAVFLSGQASKADSAASISASVLQLARSEGASPLRAACTAAATGLAAVTVAAAGAGAATMRFTGVSPMISSAPISASQAKAAAAVAGVMSLWFRGMSELAACVENSVNINARRSKR
jgi:hypothetical protein